MMLILMLIGMLTLAFNVQPIKARSSFTIGFYGVSYEIYYNSLVPYLKTLGYTVFAVDEINFTYAEVVYLDYRASFGPPAEEELLAYVENGGSLWVFGEAVGGIFMGATISTNSIWFVGSLSDPRVWIMEHPVLQDVRSIAYPDGAWLEIAGDIKGIMRIDGKTTLAVDSSKRGKILWLIDSDIFGDYFLDDGDNRVLARNIAAWLTPKTWTVDDDGPADFHTIQEAINAANPGDTIHVKSGIYYENIVVNKTVSLVGENRETTTIDGNGVGNVTEATIDNVAITGLTIRHSGKKYEDSGIVLTKVKNCNISGNKITDNNHGIRLDYSNNNSLVGNNIEANSWMSIWLWESANNSIVGNNMTNNCYGVWSSRSSNHTSIIGNIIQTSKECGILIGYSSNASIVDNDIRVSGWSGIRLYITSNTWIVRNSIVGNNLIGIDLAYSSDTNVFRNNITDNGCGVDFWESSSNSFYHNNFINNTKHVYDNAWDHPWLPPSINVWDGGYPSGGNYWSDHNPPDLYSGLYQNETGKDRIGDIPYIIDGNNTDRYPLIFPYGYVPSPDLNNDKIVDIFDLVILAEAFGTTPGNLNWNPKADLYQDEIIDIFDMVIIGINFGKTA